jgi:hypothetical protein
MRSTVLAGVAMLAVLLRAGSAPAEILRDQAGPWEISATRVAASGDIASSLTARTSDRSLLQLGLHGLNTEKRIALFLNLTGLGSDAATLVEGGKISFGCGSHGDLEMESPHFFTFSDVMLFRTYDEREAGEILWGFRYCETLRLSFAGRSVAMPLVSFDAALQKVIGLWARLERPRGAAP